MANIQYGYWRTDQPQVQGYSHELISNFSDKNQLDTLNTWPKDTSGKELKTLIEGLDALEARLPNHKWLGKKVQTGSTGSGADAKPTWGYEWMTVKETMKQSKLFGAGLVAMNLIPETEGEGQMWKFLGIQSKNRREWNLAHMGNYMSGGTTIALYDTLGAEAARFVVAQTQLTTIVCSSDLVKNMLKLKADDPNSQMTTLANIVSFEAPNAEDVSEAKGLGVNVCTYDDVIQAGQGNSSWSVFNASPEDVYMFSYTSGTTGDPKGVKLSHKMVMQCAEATNVKMGDQMLNETDVYPSYLPAAHSFEQALQATAIITGMQTGFYGGNPLALVSEDLPALKPTLFPSVPRIYNRIFGKIQDTFAAAQGCKASLIANAVSTKLANLRANGAVTHGCWDGVVFKKVKGLVGGKVRVMLTGSAPISGEVLDFMKICFCCPVIEGYGMTETSAGSFTTLMGDPVSGHVGGPQPNVKIRLKDIPEMGYSATNAEPTGECLFWGPSVMTGYFKNPEKTAEAFDGPPENGWLKSGDVVKVFPNGSIKIVDRAKNIFKLSQGEYVAPEKVENILIQSPWLGQVWLHGDSLNNHCLLVAVVDEIKFTKYVEENGTTKDQATLDTQDLRDQVYDDVLRLCKANKLNSLETPKEFKLLLEPFTVENDLLTPTFKLKRNIARKHFAALIEELYAKPPISKK